MRRLRQRAATSRRMETIDLRFVAFSEERRRALVDLSE
jgi:hypothetical protein